MKMIIPAILSNDINEIQKKFDKISGIADWAQVDIMDGVFTKAISINVRELDNIDFNINIEVHLMVNNPEKYFEDCKFIGAKRVIFHLEGVSDMELVQKKIKEYDFESGIAINPDTPYEDFVGVANEFDVIMFLAVNPGYGGQTFQDKVLDKIRKFKNDFPSKIIEVDGGINKDNIQEISKAGADYFVVGSGLFGVDDIKQRYNELKQKIN